MRNYVLLLVAFVILASCSTPKYTYYFDHYDYNSGKKNSASQGVVTQGVATEVMPHEAASDETLVASANENEVYLAKPSPAASTREVASKLKSMSKEERKELRKEVKKYVKQNKKEIKSSKSANQLENDVKLAAIFGAVGIVLLIIGGDVLSILGAVALLVGLYFFIRWLIHQ
jgi:preprotein translocase subunit SecF